MMKRLILVRHGKSSWKEDLPDEQRPLKKRAYNDADVVINAFDSFHDGPLKIWTSFANRARSTAEIFRERLEIGERDFQVREDLYTFSEDELLRIISSCEDAVETLMVFGHNPAITDVANQLGDQFFDKVPTTGLVVIDLQTHQWQQLKMGRTILYLFPKNLR